MIAKSKRGFKTRAQIEYKLILMVKILMISFKAIVVTLYLIPLPINKKISE